MILESGERSEPGDSVRHRENFEVLWKRVRDRPDRPHLKIDYPRAAPVDLHCRRTPIRSEAHAIAISRQDADAWQVAHETLKANQATAPPRHL